MKWTILTSVLSICLIAVAEEKKPAEKADLPVIASPDFETPLDGTWSVAKGKWTPAKGILTGAEVPADKHVAVLHHNVGLAWASIECDFKLDGSPQILFGCDGKGHVGRVVVKATGVDIAEDSAKPSHVIGSLKMPVTQKEWHHIKVEWSKDQMSATLDGKTVSAQHAFLATPKSRSWIAVPKNDALIRGLKISGIKTAAN